MATVAKPRARQYMLSHADAQARTTVKRIVQLEAEDPRGFDWEDGCRERTSHSFGLGSGAAAMVCVTRRSITDESAYDLEGVVRP